MQRDDLLAALNRHGEVFEQAQAALRDGDPFDVHEPPASTDELRVIYRRREEHTRSLGLDTWGFAEAVRALDETPLPTLRLVSISGSQPSRHFQLFISPEDGAVIACLALPA